MNYEAYLKSMGVKVTRHKLAVLELFTQQKHLDVNMIVHQLHEQQNDISIATVYRILSSFEANKIITKHNFGNEQAIYELSSVGEHHDHLICLFCGQVIEFINEQIEELQRAIARQNNFELFSHSLNIYGRCQRCTLNVS